MNLNLWSNAVTWYFHCVIFFAVCYIKIYKNISKWGGFTTVNIFKTCTSGTGRGCATGKCVILNSISQGHRKLTVAMILWHLGYNIFCADGMRYIIDKLPTEVWYHIGIYVGTISCCIHFWYEFASYVVGIYAEKIAYLTAGILLFRKSFS